jgi:hypothetical protein
VVWLDSADGGGPPVRLVTELIREGHVLRGVMHEFATFDVERLGFFAYGHNQFDNWIAGPYERTAPPNRPVRLGELSAEVQQAIGECRLAGVDFRRESLVQPFDLGAAHCWGDEWVSATGRRRRTDEEASESRDQSAADVGALAFAWGTQSSLPPLAATYIQGEEGALGVLNDFLEEAGLAPLEPASTVAARLENLLLQFFTEQERQQFEAECVEHALAAQLAPPDVEETIRTVLGTLRESGSTASKETLRDLSHRALAAWGDSEEAGQPEQRLAWAAWSLVERHPLIAARTARATSPHELAWQIDLVLRRLDRKFSTGQ